MVKNKLLNIFRESSKKYLGNIWIVLPSVFLWIFLVAFSKLSVKVNYQIQSTFILSVWLVFYSLVYVLVVSFFLSGLVALCASLFRNQKRNFLSSAYKFWMKNFVIIIFYILVYNCVRIVSHYSVFYIGKALNIPTNYASVLFFIVYFAGMLGILIFLTFSSFCLVIYNKSIFASIKKSIEIVKKNYIETLSVLVLLFAINKLLYHNLDFIWIEIIDAFLIVPYLAIILTKFVVDSK